MNNLIHLLNGKFVSEDELLISPRDLGFARGYAVADFLVTHNRRPFKLSKHINRLFHSAKVIGLKIPWSKTQISNWVKATLAKNDQIAEKTIKIFITGGVSKTLRQSKTPTIIMVVNSYFPKPSSHYRLKVKAIKYKRPYPKAKTTHYLEAVKQFSSEDYISEIIYYDDVQVFEGAGSNLFAVINNKLITPKSNIMEGVTREILLEILKLNIPIKVRDFTFNDLVKANEVFLTGSAKGIRAVVEINGKVIGDGQIGRITKEVARQYNKYISAST